MELPRLRAPLVLVHGLFGFGRLRLGSRVLIDYFNGLPRALEAAGNRVFVVQLAPTEGIAYRAAQLRAFINRRSPDQPVHILAHSMGGLDARFMIAHLGMADRVLTLTTLGTPHRGSPVADRARQHLAWLVDPIFDLLGVPRQGFADLTLPSCRRFNEQTLDAPQVRYFSVAGRFQGRGLNLSWGLTEPIVRRAEGPNDGLVSITSAAWGESCDVWEGDHMHLVNWSRSWAPVGKGKSLPHFARHLGRLRDEGF